MPKTESESIVAQINQGVFFKEFTFSKTDFKGLEPHQLLEFADNVVWLDDLLFVYQIKGKENKNDNQHNWFNNKILKIAVDQIKKTLKYLQDYPEICIENEKGHKLDIIKARESTIVKKIIIYSPNENLPDNLRQIKFYESTTVDLIHLFHIEDYYWICRYLITPAEISEYLDFRERLYQFNKKASNLYPEQYFLGHFLETPHADHFNPSYLSNLSHKVQNTETFNISYLIEDFNKKILLAKNQLDYYPIIQEISKLNRFELSNFKKLFSISIEQSETEEIILPYRMYSPRTDCGFVFIPLHSRNSSCWKTVLYNFTMAHKYESKATKCIGVVIFKHKDDVSKIELYWQFVNSKWEFDQELENILKDNFPFRKSTVKLNDNRYK